MMKNVTFRFMSTECVLTDHEEPIHSDTERQIHDAVPVDTLWTQLEEFAELKRVSGTEDKRIAAYSAGKQLVSQGIGYKRYELKR